MKCKDCNVEMETGLALVDVLTGTPDFVGDDYVCTMTPSGKANLTKCHKCPLCGWSVTK